MPSQYQRYPLPPPLLGIIRNVADVISGGVQAADKVPLGAFVSLHNFCVRKGQLQKVAGYVQNANSATGPVNYISQNKQGDGSVSTVIGTEKNLYIFSPVVSAGVYAGTLAQLNSTDFTCAAGDRWSADSLLNIWYFTNLADGLWIYDPLKLFDATNTFYSAASATTMAYTTKTRYLAQYFNHILTANATTGTDALSGLTVAGSSLPGFDNGTQIDPTGTVDFNAGATGTDAIVFEVPDGGREIAGVMRLLSQLVIYKPNTIMLLAYQGTSLEYSDTVQVTNNGLLSPPSLVDAGDKHFFIGQDNIYTFNGSSLQDIGTHIWDYLINDVDGNSQGNIYGFRDPRFREIYFCYIQTGSSTFSKALIYNYEYDCFYTRDWPFSAMGFVGASGSFWDPVWSDSSLASSPFTYDNPAMATLAAGIASGNVASNILMMGDASGAIWMDDESQFTANGNAIAGTAETGDMNFGEEYKFKTCFGLDIDAPTIDPTNGLQVYVLARRSLADDFTAYQGPYTMQQGWRGVDFIVSGNWFRFKLVSPGGNCVVRSITPRWVLRGDF